MELGTRWMTRAACAAVNAAACAMSVGAVLGAVLGAAVGAAAGTAGAQVVRGEVREVSTKRPVVGAAVVVSDSTRETVGFSRTDEEGKFTLRVPVTGFSVRVVRVGFAPESVSTAGFAALDTTNVRMEMRAIVVALSPVVIEAEKRQIRDMRVFGLNLKVMSTHIITPSGIEVTGHAARTYLDAIRTALPAGVMVSERSQCVSSNRAGGLKSLGGGTCAMVMVDGVSVSDETAIDLVQPQWLDHAIFVRAVDAGVMFGTGAAGGVLMLFTKWGGYALDRP